MIVSWEGLATMYLCFECMERFRPLKTTRKPACLQVLKGMER